MVKSGNSSEISKIFKSKILNVKMFKIFIKICYTFYVIVNILYQNIFLKYLKIYKLFN